MYYYLYDENGHFIGMTETRPEHNRWTNIPNTYSFVIEKWNGSAWVEGATIEEISQVKTPIYESKIIELFTYLMNRALSSSMGKYGTYEYLQIQRDEYFLKYKVAKGIEENPPIADAILKEMERDFPTPMLDAILTSYGYTDLNGTQLEKMYVLIVIRYEYANSRLQNYQAKSIDFRTKCRTLVELFQWQKLDTAFALIENLPNELSDTDIENYYNQFDAL